ncbi:hypothetical protein CDV31_005169 [Fusarium ambrosium]|uniref:DJ-1/PfpI domain-containing protein n=1 Tax=Fusarium ambrosium TaxID=131363 RepID=A0A428ULC3_9HYPO|nr:hypothetical protein CDV31_005169 [Fusarium ambrosium]
MAPVHIGALLFDYQAIDVIGPIDLLNSCNKKYMSALQPLTGAKDETVSHAPEFIFHHIGVDKEPVHLLSSDITIVPSATVDDCPELDILIIGGPDPVNFKLHPKHADFLRKHVAGGKLLFTNCTGAAVAASTGVLDGKNATINNLAFRLMKQVYPNVNWSIDKKWIVDGNIWTGGGAVAGMDMISYWIKENYGLDILSQASSMLDFEPRDINGVLNVLPKRYDESGNQLSTHVFP